MNHSDAKVVLYTHFAQLGIIFLTKVGYNYCDFVSSAQFFMLLYDKIGISLLYNSEKVLTFAPS